MVTLLLPFPYKVTLSYLLPSFLSINFFLKFYATFQDNRNRDKHIYKSFLKNILPIFIKLMFNP